MNRPKETRGTGKANVSRAIFIKNLTLVSFLGIVSANAETINYSETMTVNEIAAQLIESTAKILNNTGIINVIPPSESPGKNLMIKFKTKNKGSKEYSLYFDIKSIGQPRHIRRAL